MTIVMPLLLSLGAMIGWGILNFIMAKLSRQTGPFASLFFLQLLGIPFLVLLLPFIHQPISLQGILSFTALGIFDTCVFLLFLYATKIGNLSVVSSISRASILVTVVLSVIFLHEPLTSWRIVSILMTLIGVILLSVDFSNKDKSHKASLFKGVPLVLLEAVGVGIYMFLVAPLVRDYGWYNSSLIIRIAITITVFIMMIVQGKQVHLNKNLWPYAVAAALSDVIAFSLYNIAVARYDVSYVSIVTSSSSIVTLGLAYFFLKEKLNRFQLFGFFLTVIGIVVLQIV
jgi:transporter family protein